MKIWFLTGEFKPDFGGGIGTYVENCAAMFAKNGDDVTVVVRGKYEKYVEETSEEGYRIVRFASNTGKLYRYLGYETGLAEQYYETVIKLIDKYGKPDVIEVQEYNAYGQFVIQHKLTLNPKLKDIPIVVHLHTPSFETQRINKAPMYELPGYWIGEMEKFCIKGADALLCPSEFLAKKLQGMTDTKIKVINLPFNIDEDEIKKAKENLDKYKSDKKTILYFGRTEYRKGVIQMLAGCKNLWDKGVDFKLKIIGGDTILAPKGEYIGEMLKKKYAKYIESGNLEMLNSIPHLDLIPHILSATAVTIPSIYENFPNTCIYSMWLGKPVLVSKDGGMAEMVQKSGENGIIFDWSKENDFENKLEEMLNLSDKELSKMGKNAKARINKLCNMEDNLKMRSEFFKEVIKNKKEKKEFPFLYSMDKVEHKKKYDGKKDLLSVVIPYYNLGKTLPETIESVKEVDYKDVQIVILNDGSTDEESLEVLKKYEGDKNIKIVNVKNGGLARARNIGAEHADGEYIAFLDADDKIEKTFYSKAIKILKQYNNVSYVYSWVQNFEGNDGIWPTFNIHIPYLLCANMLAAFVVIRKNDFLNFGLNRPQMEYGMEDYDSWISLAENGYMGVAIPDTLNIYRVRKDSMSRAFNKNMRLFLYERMRDGHDKIYEKFNREVQMLLLSNGPAYYWGNPSAPVYLPGGEGNSDERIERIYQFMDSLPGRGLRKVKRKAKSIGSKK